MIEPEHEADGSTSSETASNSGEQNFSDPNTTAPTHPGQSSPADNDPTSTPTDPSTAGLFRTDSDQGESSIGQEGDAYDPADELQTNFLTDDVVPFSRPEPTDLTKSLQSIDVKLEARPVSSNPGIYLLDTQDVRLVCAWMNAAADGASIYCDLTQDENADPISVITMELDDIILDLVKSSSTKPRCILINFGSLVSDVHIMQSLNIDALSDELFNTYTIYLCGEEWASHTNTSFHHVDHPDQHIIRSICDAAGLLEDMPNGQSLDDAFSDQDDCRDFLSTLFLDLGLAKDWLSAQFEKRDEQNLPKELRDSLDATAGETRPSLFTCLYLLSRFESLPISTFEALHASLSPALHIEPEVPPKEGDPPHPKYVDLISSDFANCRAAFSRAASGQKRILLLVDAWRKSLRRALERRVHVVRKAEALLLSHAGPCFSDKYATSEIARILATRLMDDNQLNTHEGAIRLANLLWPANGRRMKLKEIIGFLSVFCDELAKQPISGGAPGAIAVRLILQLSDYEAVGFPIWQIIWAFSLGGPSEHVPSALPEALKAAYNDSTAFVSLNLSPEFLKKNLTIILKTVGPLLLKKQEKGQVFGYESLIVDWMIVGWLMTHNRDAPGHYKLRILGNDDDKTELRRLICQIVMLDQTSSVLSTFDDAASQRRRFTISTQAMFHKAATTSSGYASRLIRNYVRDRLNVISYRMFSLRDELFERGTNQPPEKDAFDMHLDAVCSAPQLLVFALLHDIENEDSGTLVPDNEVIELMSKRIEGDLASKRLRRIISQLADDMQWAIDYLVDNPVAPKEHQKQQRALIRSNRRLLKNLSRAVTPPRPR